jgi:hypothetical protein
MRFIRSSVVGLGILAFVVGSTGESLAGTQLYQGSWIAESFGNDKVNIGTKESKYFEALGIPQGINCHGKAPLCNISSTPVTTTGCVTTPTDTCPGPNGTKFNPLGPGCRPLTAGEKPRPAKGGTLRPPNNKATGPPHYGCPGTPATAPPCTCPAVVAPCDKTPPLYRNQDFFTLAGSPSNQTCEADDTVLLGKTTVYLGPGDPRRGIAMKGAPLTGLGTATATGTAFKFPAQAEAAGPYPGMRRTTNGSFIGEGPYLYSYTYAKLRNDKGTFGPGQGFFGAGAVPTTVQFKHKDGGTTVHTVKVTRGSNRFGGVMKLLGSYTNKVCYFYAGGCGLGYGDWGYENIGAAGYKSAGGVVTKSWTTLFVQTYYNTGIGTFAKYNVVEQRFPWTTGTVTVNATARGPNNTHERRVGFDNRVGGVGTVQLVSPIITQWLAQSAAAVKMETGGIAVMQIKFLPEPSVLTGLAAGLSLLALLNRFRRS